MEDFNVKRIQQNRETFKIHTNRDGGGDRWD